MKYDLLPTNKSSRICVGLTTDDRAEDIQNLPHCLDKLPAPGLTAEKANECKTKIRPIAPTDAAYEYYTRMETHHKEELKQKIAAKNKTRKEKNEGEKSQDHRGQRRLDPPHKIIRF